MARRVFFSFHFERDIWRVSQVRQSWRSHPDRESAGFWDAAEWETVRRGGDRAIRRWIDEQLHGTSVTVVLIGAETGSRDYVLHEVQRSIELNKGLLGVRIHGLRDQDGQSDRPGPNPFQRLGVGAFTPVYDWVTDDGYSNIGDWVEAAARQAGR